MLYTIELVEKQFLKTTVSIEANTQAQAQALAVDQYDRTPSNTWQWEVYEACLFSATTSDKHTTYY